MTGGVLLLRSNLLVSDWRTTLTLARIAHSQNVSKCAVQWTLLSSCDMSIHSVILEWCSRNGIIWMYKILTLLMMWFHLFVLYGSHKDWQCTEPHCVLDRSVAWLNWKNKMHFLGPRADEQDSLVNSRWKAFVILQLKRTGKIITSTPP